MGKLIYLKTIRNKNGYIIIFIVMILLVISLLLGLVLSINFISRSKVSIYDSYRSQALYLAESGVREVILYLSKGQTPPNPLTKQIGFYLDPLGTPKYKGRFEATYQKDTPDQGQYLITSTGYVPLELTQSEQVKRTIKVIIDSSFKLIYWEEENLEFVK